MPQYCIVQGCTNRSNKVGCEDISFHHLPFSNAHVLRQWIIKARLPDKLLNKTSRICSVHFLGGKRKHLSDVPEVFPWTQPVRKPPPQKFQPTPSHVRPSLSPPHIPPLCPTAISPPLLLSSRSAISPPLSFSPPPLSPASPCSTSPSALSAPLVSEDKVRNVNHDHTYSVPTTQSQSSIVDENDVSLDNSIMVDMSIQCSFADRAFSISLVCDDDNAIHFYTGLPDYRTFLACYEFLGNSVNNLSYWYGGKLKPQTNLGAPRALSPMNELFLVLCRLRLGTFRERPSLQISNFTIYRVKSVYNVPLCEI